MSEMTEIVKRHGNHHFINVKYGYVVLLLISVHIFYFFISRRIYLKKWITSGRATTFQRWVSIKDTWILTLWVFLLVGLLFFHFSPHELNVFIKRMGRFAYVLVPFDIFLSLKPNPLPNVYYMELIFLHKWIGRLIVLFGVLHSIGFVIIWITSGEGQILKMFKLLNFLGVVAIIGFLIQVIVSVKFIRRRFYRTFFTTHLVIAWVVVFLLQFHARPGVTLYTLLNLSLIFLQFATKMIRSRNITIETIAHHNSFLKIIQFDNIWIRNFVSASHLRLSYSKKNPLTYILPSHPYTIASRPDEQKIKLVVKENTSIFKTGEIRSVFGPFPSIHQNFFQTVDKAVVIAGGSGISFALGIYENLIRQSSVGITLIWILRNQEDLWILRHFNINNADIYITVSKEESSSSQNDDSFDEIEQLLDTNEQLEDRDHDSFELNELDPFDDSNKVSQQNRKSESNIQIKYGRPDLKSYTNRLNNYDKANNWVISCGSSSLNKSCKSWADSLKVRYHSESFDL